MANLLLYNYKITPNIMEDHSQMIDGKKTILMPSIIIAGDKYTSNRHLSIYGNVSKGRVLGEAFSQAAENDQGIFRFALRVERTDSDLARSNQSNVNDLHFLQANRTTNDMDQRVNDIYHSTYPHLSHDKDLTMQEALDKTPDFIDRLFQEYPRLKAIIWETSIKVGDMTINHVKVAALRSFEDINSIEIIPNNDDYEAIFEDNSP